VIRVDVLCILYSVVIVQIL